MTEYTRIQDRFEYHTEDLDWCDCLQYDRKKKREKTGCGLDTLSALSTTKHPTRKRT